jgi:cardiolipin synthase C
MAKLEPYVVREISAFYVAEAYCHRFTTRCRCMERTVDRSYGKRRGYRIGFHALDRSARFAGKVHIARLLASAIVLLVAACSGLPPGHEQARQESHALPPVAAALGVGASEEAAHAGQSAFRMIATGLDGLAMRIEAIDSAQRSVDLQYYIFRVDESGGLVAKGLLRAADRGVRVRILLDDGESIAGDEKLFALAAHPLIQIRIFNPFDYRGHNRALRALDFAINKNRLDYRMHNKLMVVDNSLAMIGGRNIGDQYFQIDPRSQFGDDDVVVMGPMTRRLSGVFDEFWNGPLSIPIDAIDKSHSSGKALAALRESLDHPQDRTPLQTGLSSRLSSRQPLSDLIGDHATIDWAASELIYDSPNKHSVVDRSARGRLISTPMEACITGVSSELLMITPYLVPSPREEDLLQRMQRRNARARMLTNSLEAAPNIAAHSGYAKYRPKLLKDGVELHEIRARVESTKGTGQSRTISAFGHYALHAKLYVFDRRSVFVGSMNFDRRSERLNTEIGLIIDSPPIAAAAASRFEALTQLTEAYSVQLVKSSEQHKEHLVWRTEEHGVVTALFKEPGRDAWQRFKARMLAWLPLDGEL